MPRVTSQDGLGICYAHVGATMMQFENCKAHKVDCASLPESQLFSPLDLTRLKAPKEGEEIEEGRAYYEGLNVDGGNPHNVAIIGALATRRAASEECVSLDRILSKMSSRGEAVEAQNAMWMRLKRHFEAAKKMTQGKENCPECLDQIYATAVDKIQPEIQENLDIKADNVKIAKAFATETFEKFLDELTGAYRCRRAHQIVAFENYDSLTYLFYPKEGSATPQQIKSKVKEVLKTGHPLALAGVCLGNEAASSCKPDNFHSVVVAGHRQICNAQGKCRESFKVINSWGKSWQDQYDGGWVDADTLLAHTKLGPEVLGWFAKKQ